MTYKGTWTLGHTGWLHAGWDLQGSFVSLDHSEFPNRLLSAWSHTHTHTHHHRYHHFWFLSQMSHRKARIILEEVTKEWELVLCELLSRRDLCERGKFLPCQSSSTSVCPFLFSTTWPGISTTCGSLLCL